MGLFDAVLGAVVGGVCAGPLGAVMFGAAGAMDGAEGLGTMADAFKDEPSNVPDPSIYFQDKD